MNTLENLLRTLVCRRSLHLGDNIVVVEILGMEEIDMCRALILEVVALIAIIALATARRWCIAPKER